MSIEKEITRVEKEGLDRIDPNVPKISARDGPGTGSNSTARVRYISFRQGLTRPANVICLKKALKSLPSVLVVRNVLVYSLFVFVPVYLLLRL